MKFYVLTPSVAGLLAAAVTLTVQLWWYTIGNNIRIVDDYQKPRVVKIKCVVTSGTRHSGDNELVIATILRPVMIWLQFSKTVNGNEYVMPSRPGVNVVM